MPYYNRDPKRYHNFDNHPHHLAGGAAIFLLNSEDSKTSPGYCYLLFVTAFNIDIRTATLNICATKSASKNGVPKPYKPQTLKLNPKP